MAPAGAAAPNMLAFAKQNTLRLNEEIAALYLVRDDRVLPEDAACSFIPVANPRLACAKVAAEFFAPRPEPRIADTAIIGENVRIGSGVTVGEYSVIGDHVVIGAGTRVGHHAVVAENTTIGERCVIKSHAVIGEQGFGFDFEPDGRPVRIPHIGRTVIGNDVEIGNGVTVCRATWGATIIGDHVKIDDHVHVGHNCRIDANTIIVAGAIVGGSVRVGESAWLGPNCSIIQKVTIGRRALVGIGALVTRDVPDDVAVVGQNGRTVPRAFFDNPTSTARPAPNEASGRDES
ncbi:MAG TPA: UDP-3-O-(3-hydroxymyristoyl)glucosamine N-acyltransferase [Thermoguttaceae bacterium]|nr:UDP-3-O-(3-hydroxymyristoyl)glucosamine N-acyltransferase [Thermoguttaceae bacterium]